MKRKSLATSITLALATATLVACGGGSGGSSSNGSASISSVGTITGFGSIFVNGIEYETGNASYRVDDEDQFDDSSLAVGMKVRVKGTVNADGVSGTATSVLYDDDVEGPIDTGSLTVVDAATKTFTIFGLLVKVDVIQTVFDNGVTFDTLTEGQKLEISGYFDGSQVIATRIEKQNDLDSEFEVKGTVAGYDGSTITLTLQNGASAGPFTIGSGAMLNIPANPVGQFVEIKLADQAGNLIAIKIETDDKDLLDDDEDDVSIRGVLIDDGNGGFLVNGVPFSVSDNTDHKPDSLKDSLMAGMEVKVEGHMQGGVLIADEVEKEDGEIKIEARVLDVSLSTAKKGIVTLDLGNSQSLDVHSDNSTLFEDVSSSDSNGDESFNLDELAIGMDFVEIEAYLNDNDDLVATSIERDDAGSTRLEAPLDSFDPNVSVSLLGITWMVGSVTTYEVNDTPSNNPAAFFSALNSNSVVKVKDAEPDGTAEELDLED